MTTKKQIRTVLTLAAAALAVLAGPAQVGALEGELGILTPGTLAGNNPATGAPWADGDQYRFAFFTSATTAATEPNILYYNAFVQDLANASTAYDIGADDGVTWNVIGSTSNVDARDNTSTNPTVNGTGETIFLLDGSTVVANDYADLWDGEVQNIINITEQGLVDAHWPFTGTYTDGTSVTGKPTSFSPLGGGNDVNQGNSGSTTQWIWRTWTSAPAADPLNIYALSDPLVIGGGDPNIPDVDAGDDWTTWSSEPVTMNATVTNNTSDPVTALTYAWTVDAASLADTNLTIEIANDDQEDATVTITKTAPTGDATVVTMTLAGNNAGSGKDDVTDTMTIDVYDDSCLAAEAAGTVEFDPTDVNADCITNLKDFAELAAAWLVDYTLTAPEPLP